MVFKHTSVLLTETIEGLQIKPDGVYVDGTLGGGGHSYEIAGRLNAKGKLIGIDQDDAAIKAAGERLKEYGDKVTIVRSNYRNTKGVLTGLGVEQIDGMMLDLGVSSYQLDNAERGFSYMHNSRLDMRMNTDNPKSAYEVINEYSKEELMRVFYDYGEEKWSARIAEFIIERRAKKPVETTFELVDIIKAAIPKKARSDGSHPAKRIFQAVRIEVNNELGILKGTISDIVDALKPGGRLAIITFHSLEDRIVKVAYQEKATGCICPKSFPVCVCNRQPVVKLINKKPILPSEQEEIENSRSKSAKLRILEKL